MVEKSKWVLESGTYSGLSNTWRTEPQKGEDTAWERRMTISSLPRTVPPSGINMLSYKAAKELWELTEPTLETH